MVLAAFAIYAPTVASSAVKPFEVEAYQQALDVSPAVAENDLEVQAEGAEADILGDLEAGLNEDFAGLWFDPASGEYVVSMASNSAGAAVGKEMAAARLAGDYRTRVVQHSWEELQAAQDQINSRLREFFDAGLVYTSLDSRTNSAVVHVSATASAKDRASLMRIANGVGDEVELRTSDDDRLQGSLEVCSKLAAVPNCSRPIRGGVEIGRWQEGKPYGFCTLGFPAIGNTDNKRYVITAAHCSIEAPGGGPVPQWHAFDEQELPYVGEPHYLGKVTQYSSYPAEDWMKIDASGTWWSEGSWGAQVAYWQKDLVPPAIAEEYPIYGEASSIPGIGVCHSGIRTGGSCGQIAETEVTLDFGNVTEHNLVKVVGGNNCSTGGDSGGPYFASNIAYGLHIGSVDDFKTCGDPTFYQEITRATDSLDVHLAPPGSSGCDGGGFDDAAPGPRAVIECNGIRHVFYRTPQGSLQHNWYAPGGSWGHQTLPGSPASEPHPVLARNGYIHVFYRTPSGGLAQTWYNPGEGNGGWGNPGWAEQILPGSVSGEPHALSDDNGFMYVFYRTPSGGLAQTWYNPGEGNGGWGNPGWAEQILPGSVASEPHPVLGDGVWNNYVYVFYRTPSGGLAQTWYNPGFGNGGWGSPSWNEQILPGSVSGQPHPVSGKGVWDNYFYVFYRQPGGGLAQTWYNPGEGLGGWGSASWNFQNLPGSPASEPHPTHDKNGYFYVFYRTSSNGLAQTWYNPGAGMGGWGEPGWNFQNLPGSVSGEPRPILNDNGFAYVFYRQPGGGLAQTWYNPGAGMGGWGSPGWAEEALPGSPASEPHPVLDKYGWNGFMYVFYRTPSGGLGHTWYNPGETMGGWGAGGWSPEILEGSVAARPPAVSTGAAGGVTTGEAKLAGTVNPEGSRTTYYFEYGTTASYGSKQPVSAKDAGNEIDAAAVSETISGLTPNTLYHYRLVATSPEGTTNGTDKTFVTAATGIAGKLPAMPVTEPFNGGTASLARFNADWSALGWAAGANPKGSNTTTGWRPLDAYPTVNGAFSKSTITDTGPGTAAVATMAANPGSASRYFSLWLDASGSASTRSGYELRFTYVSSNTYDIALSKWQSGTQTPLAGQSGYSFANGNSLALVDTGAAVSAWSDTGSGFSQLLSAGDSAFSSGNAGLEGAGESTRLTKFKAGLLPALGGKFATSTVWGGWSLGFSMYFADVNADGRADILGRSNGTGEVQVGLSNGSKFNTSSSWGGWSLGYAMDFADVNGDGRADIIGRNNGTGEVQVGLSTGTKFNSGSQWTNWSLNYSMDFADVNKDGKADLLGRNAFGEVKVGLSTGSSFSSASSWGSWSTSYSVDFADAHADGRADVTGVNSSGDVQVGLSTGSAFSAGSSWISWPTNYSVSFADANGDGHADILGRNNSTGEVKVGLSSGVSFNSGAQWAPSWSLGFSMLFADVNADGRADIIGRNQTNGEVQVGLSTGL